MEFISKKEKPMQEFAKKQLKYNEAQIWAIELHGSQKYGALPYGYHLITVSSVLARFGFSIFTNLEEHIVAILHDAVEDRKTNFKEVAKRFGEDIARILMLVTDELKALSREERHRKTYPELAKDQRAVLVKLGDRIANVEQCHKEKNMEQHKKYRSEYGYFRETLFNSEHTHLREMWNHLDSLHA